jgi:hypothetical protein
MHEGNRISRRRVIAELGAAGLAAVAAPPGICGKATEMNRCRRGITG